MLIWLWKAPYGPRFRQASAAAQPAGPRVAVRGLGEALSTLRHIRGNRVILLMTSLAGAASFFIGTAYQAQMPGFAIDVGHGDPGLFYGNPRLLRPGSSSPVRGRGRAVGQ